MTNKEATDAMKIIKYACALDSGNTNSVTDELFDMAIKALEREIPRMVNPPSNPYYKGDCPTCGHTIFSSPYCPMCGQRLKWSE